MMTTWQKIIVITVAAIIGAIVGYIVIENNIEKIEVPTIQSDNSTVVFEQYVEKNNVTVNNSSKK